MLMALKKKKWNAYNVAHHNDVSEIVKDHLMKIICGNCGVLNARAKPFQVKWNVLLVNLSKCSHEKHLIKTN